MAWNCKNDVLVIIFVLCLSPLLSALSIVLTYQIIGVAGYGALALLPALIICAFIVYKRKKEETIEMINGLAFFGTIILGTVIMIVHLQSWVPILLTPEEYSTEWFLVGGTRNPVLITVYGVISSLLIICGTAWVGSVFFKRTKTNLTKPADHDSWSFRSGDEQ